MVMASDISRNQALPCLTSLSGACAPGLGHAGPRDPLTSSLVYGPTNQPHWTRLSSRTCVPTLKHPPLGYTPIAPLAGASCPWETSCGSRLCRFFFFFFYGWTRRHRRQVKRFEYSDKTELNFLSTVYWENPLR